MRNYINGYSFPIFTIKDLNGNKIDSINLDFTDETGLVIDNKPVYINHDLLNYNTFQKILGYHIYFNLSYESYSSKENSLKIGNIFNYFLTNKHKIFITPRSDFERNTWEVILLNEGIKEGINKGGDKAQGNRLIRLELRTKYLQKNNIYWYDMDEIKSIGSYKYPYVGFLQT